MADTIKVLGNNIPKPVAIGGGIIVLAGGVYFYRTKKQKSDAAASVAAAGSSEIDPATGYPFGSPEDAAAMSTQDNYQLPTAGGGYGFQGYAGGSGGVFGTGTPGSFTSNAEWAQYVEAYEENNLGADAPTVGNAIGKYLTGQALTTDQVGLVQSAIAIAGYPPVSGPNGNPPNYVTANTGNTNPPPPGNGGGNPPPTPTPKDKTFRTTGGKTLNQIAKQLGVQAATIASMTAARDYNKGKAWPYISNWNKPIPAGIILVYGVQ